MKRLTASLCALALILASLPATSWSISETGEPPRTPAVPLNARVAPEKLVSPSLMPISSALDKVPPAPEAEKLPLEAQSALAGDVMRPVVGQSAEGPGAVPTATNAQEASHPLPSLAPAPQKKPRGRFRRALSRLPPVTTSLVLANVAIAGLLGHPAAAELKAMNFVESIRVQDAGQILRNAGNLISYMFLHASIMHLFSNMSVLAAYGPKIERVLGWRRILSLYTAAGLAAGLVFVALHWSGAQTLVGASGAIAGLVGAYLYLYPKVTSKITYLDLALWAWGFNWVINNGQLAVIKGSLPSHSPLTHIDVVGHFVGLIVGAAAARGWWRRGKIPSVGR